MERNVLKERLMTKDDKNRHFVLLIIDISKHGAKEMMDSVQGIQLSTLVSRGVLLLLQIVRRLLCSNNNGTDNFL
jgi:hypothetical protein